MIEKKERSRYFTGGYTSTGDFHDEQVRDD
jgi:hypothetical protein